MSKQSGVNALKTEWRSGRDVSERDGPSDQPRKRRGAQSRFRPFRVVVTLIFIAFSLMGQSAIDWKAELKKLSAKKNTLAASDLPALAASANGGDAGSQWMLAFVYYDGKITTKDWTQAAYWFQRARDRGFAPAAANLGFLYRFGQGVQNDNVKAAQLFLESIDHGVDSFAQPLLADMYLKGEGVPRDVNKAIAWHKKAADGGRSQSARRLGDLYLFGDGVSRDHQEALSWYQKAVAAGDKTAAPLVELLDPPCATALCMDVRMLIAERNNGFQRFLANPQGPKIPNETFKDQSRQKWNVSLVLPGAKDCEAEVNEGPLDKRVFYSRGFGPFPNDDPAHARMHALMEQITASLPREWRLSNYENHPVMPGFYIATRDKIVSGFISPCFRDSCGGGRYVQITVHSD